jgi:hypothetical protein
MFVLGLALLLAVIGVAAFPCWRYSARWGYVPSTVAGGLLALVALLVIGDRSLPTPHTFLERNAAQRSAPLPPTKTTLDKPDAPTEADPPPRAGPGATAD